MPSQTTLSIIQALWRPITAFIMAAVVLATALGWLPHGAEEHVNVLLTTAGTVLLGLTGSRAVQRVVETKADAQKAIIEPELLDELKKLLAERASKL